jgi:quercetin dioxygenase-like cupin family protein
MVQFLVDPTEAANSFGLIRSVVAPGVAIPLHSHADLGVMFVIDGALEFLQHKLQQHPGTPLRTETPIREVYSRSSISLS